MVAELESEAGAGSADLLTRFAHAVDELHASAEDLRPTDREHGAHHVAHVALRADVSTALSLGSCLPDMLQQCAEAVVHHLNGAFARIWTVSQPDNVLTLRASAGLYTHRNGPHSRIRVGQFKIGHIAQTRRPLLTNDVRTDPAISDHAWAEREGMVAFAGYPLVVEERLVGVIAMFARAPLRAEHVDALAGVADAIAQGIERKRAEEALRHANDELERRVAARTAELRLANAQLQVELAERTQVEQALRASELRFRMLVEQSPLSTQILAPDGRTVQTNRAWQRLWGVTLDEIGAYNLLEDPQLIAKGVMPFIRRGFAGEAVEIPPICYDPDETLPNRTHHAEPKRWVRAFIYPVKDEVGQIHEVVLIHEDITERQNAAEALRESETRYRTLFENFPNGSVFLFDRNLRYTVARGTGLAASGFSPDMFEGKTIWEIFPPEVAARDEPVLSAALRGETTQVEVPFGVKTYLVHTLPVKDAAGTIVGGMVMTQDMTDRKRAEEHLQFLAEAGAILGASLDFDATLQSIVRLAVPLLGEVCAVFIGGPDGIIQPVAVGHVDPVKAEHLREHQQNLVLDLTGAHPVVEVIRTGQPVIKLGSLEGAPHGVVQDGDRSTSARGLVPPSHVILPLTVREQVLGAIVFGWSDAGREFPPVNIQLAEELTRLGAQALDHTKLYRQAQEALRTRDEFLSIAAHELKTPLTTLRGSAQIVHRRAARTPSYSLTERDQRMLKVIDEQSQRLQRQIDTLLDLSQIGTNRLRLAFRPTDLCRLVERIVDEIGLTLERHQVVCTCELASLVIDGDEGRLEQVVQNLLQNAVKYSPDGGAITIHVGRRGTEACIAITDQGIGIPAEAQTKLFERFYRAENAASRGIGGLGIGLAVVADIVARHGGRVEVASVEGQGSTFRVMLPEERGRLDRARSAVDI